MSSLLRPLHVGLAVLAGLVPFACSTNTATSPAPAVAHEAVDAGHADSGAEVPDARAPQPSDARAPQPFNGDCSSARWANVSDACWSCFCTRCGTSLNACDDACMKGVACANEKHALVGVGTDISCELRAFNALCLSDPTIATAATALLNFDTCLITSHDAAKEHLRACEAECGTVYTGDVCERFPAPDGG